jgi:ubiquinone/menaquinone biosynthesis C-methylase UbiE
MGDENRTGATRISSDYQIIEGGALDSASLNGWHELDVARTQHDIYAGLLDAMMQGELREDFRVACEAVQATGLEHPSLLEVGCGSGYYNRVFAHLLQVPVDYSGLDYSSVMIRLAQQHYPGLNFMQGDAMNLPLPDASFDIVMNGAALMHMMNYPAAIAESRRVSRRWSIFHTVPVIQQRATTTLTKNAYGHPTAELVFNEEEFRSVLTRSGLTIRQVWESIPYNLEHVLGEPTTTKTFLCEAV